MKRSSAVWLLAFALLEAPLPALATPAPVAAPHAHAYVGAKATLLGMRYPLLGAGYGAGGYGGASTGTVTFNGDRLTSSNRNGVLFLSTDLDDVAGFALDYATGSDGFGGGVLGIYGTETAASGASQISLIRNGASSTAKTVVIDNAGTGSNLVIARNNITFQQQGGGNSFVWDRSSGNVAVSGILTVTGDANFNGGVGAVGYGAGETLVPADGTLNVTGALNASGAIDAGGNLTINGGNVLRFVDNNVNVAETGTNDMQLRAAGSDFLFTSDAGAATGTISVDGSGNLSLDKDFTLNGGTGALGFASGETVVPADGTLNVTGAFTATGRIIGNDVLIGSCATCVVYGGTGPANGSNGNGKLVLPNASTNELRSAMADGASAEGNRISVHADYTTSGAKILSVGDNAGTSYSEKASIDLNGTGTFGGAVKSNGFFDTTGAGSANVNLRDASSNTLLAAIDAGTTGGLSAGATAKTIADNGNGGTAATDTTLPVGFVITVTCSDAQGCVWTPTETSATDGIVVHVVNVGTNTLTMDHVAGQVQLVGAADVALGQFDSLEMVYSSSASAWIQLAGTANN